MAIRSFVRGPKYLKSFSQRGNSYVALQRWDTIIYGLNGSITAFSGLESKKYDG